MPKWIISRIPQRICVNFKLVWYICSHFNCNKNKGRTTFLLRYAEMTALSPQAVCLVICYSSGNYRLMNSTSLGRKIWTLGNVLHKTVF